MSGSVVRELVNKALFCRTFEEEKMVWEPPHHWEEALVHTMHEVLHERGMDGMDITRKKLGVGHRHIWNWGNINPKTGTYSLPTTRSLVLWCEAVGIAPSEVLKRCGL